MTFQVFLEWIQENLFINYPLLIQTLIDRHPLRSQHQQTQPASTELRPVPFLAWNQNRTWNRVRGVWVQWLTLWQLSWTLLLGSSEEMFKISWLNRFLVFEKSHLPASVNWADNRRIYQCVSKSVFFSLMNFWASLSHSESYKWDNFNKTLNLFHCCERGLCEVQHQTRFHQADVWTWIRDL